MRREYLGGIIHIEECEECGSEIELYHCDWCDQPFCDDCIDEHEEMCDDNPENQELDEDEDADEELEKEENDDTDLA